MREPRAQQDGLNSFLLHQSSRYLYSLPLVPHYYRVEPVGVGLYDGSMFGVISVSCMGYKTNLEHSIMVRCLVKNNLYALDTRAHAQVYSDMLYYLLYEESD